MALHGRDTLSKIRSGLLNRTPFNAGNVRGMLEYDDTGIMPEPYASEYADAAKRNAITYTVLSYRTPIAWLTIDGVWHVPEVKYSQSTTNHQNVVWRILELGRAS